MEVTLNCPIGQLLQEPRQNNWIRPSPLQTSAKKTTERSRMCRMLAYSGATSNTDNILREFRQLAERGMAPPGESPGHKDGWGILCYDHNLPKELGRRPSNAMEDKLYMNTLNQASRLRPNLLLAHLRKASPGVTISLENTQPLYRGTWSFAHNGTIWSPLFMQNNGPSDSVIFFEKLLDTIRDRPASDNLNQRILRAVGNLRRLIIDHPDSERRTYTSITFILSNGKTLWVLRDFNDSSDEEYYTMHCLQSADCILFCQEKITPGDWESLDNGSMAIVDQDRKLEIVASP